jgi:hypothetical protein
MQGFNSSMICLERVPILRKVVEMLISEELGSMTLMMKVFEVYGDTFRDLVDSSSNVEVKDTHNGIIPDGVTTTTIDSLNDFDNIIKRVDQNSGNDGKSWVVYEIQILQTIDDNVLYSRLRVINTCSIEYSGMERTKLVLTEGLLMAESMKEFYEIVLNPSLMRSTKSVIPLLLEAELGGNSSVRWIAKLPENIELDAYDQILWLFNILSHARGIENIPVTNTQFVVENQKRLWVFIIVNFQSRMYKMSTAAVLPQSLIIEKSKQRERDLLERINTLIKSASDSATVIQQYKQEVLKERKNALEVKLQMSKLNDEVSFLEGKLHSLHEKEKVMMFKVSEKV